MTRAVALVLTAMTGFSGLVYEVVWQKYLATLLGSHSEATAAVLAIFLGGLSIGYWLFGWLTRRLVSDAQRDGRSPRILLVYGILEASIGGYVIAFPWLFEIVQAISFAIPHSASGLGFALDVLLTVVLIGPASVLMGGTIPMLTQALAKSLEDATRFHAFVYAFNTVGAFAGALAAGFYLIPKLGLVNVMLSMGLINLTAGAIFMLIGRHGSRVISLNTAAPTANIDDPIDPDEPAIRRSLRTYYAVALLCGFAMMSLQTTAIRISGLSFGSSQFTFSMVVAVFVLCIALGSFAVSSMKDISKSLVVTNQWALCGLSALLYFQIEKSPYWAYMLRARFDSTDDAFLAYYAAGFASVLLLIGFPVVLSGAVLPLLFHLMRRDADHLGDAAGNLYSWNTVGSLIGALFGGYILFLWFDLHEIYRLAVAALAVAAILITQLVYDWRRWTVACSLVAAFVGLFAMPAWDQHILNAGLFREHKALPGNALGFHEFIEKNPSVFQSRFLFHTDDPISSVIARVGDVGDGVSSLSIVVNGKSDGDTFKDFKTMSLLATIPSLFAEKAERAFVIGWGTGVTVGELTTFGSIQHIEVAEISPGVLQAAPLFDFANHDASKNPKVTVHPSDAYRALVRSNGEYDVIISEPSNPWVTGIEMLFSREFLQVAKSKLSPGGVYCQWFHEYETDSEVIEIVFRTYSDVFDHVAIWRTQVRDLLLIGFNDPGIALDQYRLEERANRPDFKASLRRVQINSFPELLAHELLPLGVVHAIALEGPVHTLYHPILNYAAGRAFFRGENGKLPFSGFGSPAAIGRKNSLLRRYAQRTDGELSAEDHERVIVEACRTHGIICNALLAEWKNADPLSPGFIRTERRVNKIISLLREHSTEIADPMLGFQDLTVMTKLFGEGASAATGDSTIVSLDTAARASREYADFYFHASPFATDALDSIWSGCSDVSSVRFACVARLDADGVDYDEASIRRCMDSGDKNWACREGRKRAMKLVNPQ